MYRTINIILGFVLFCAFTNCKTTKKEIEKPSTTVSTSPPQFDLLTYNNFDELMKEREGLQMAYFWATWCGPCRTISPALDNISRNYAGQLTIGKLDVDADKVTADIHGVTSIPAFLFFKDGNLVFQTSGLVTEQYLINVIDRLK